MPGLSISVDGDGCQLFGAINDLWIKISEFRSWTWQVDSTTSRPFDEFRGGLTTLPGIYIYTSLRLITFLLLHLAT